MRWILTLLLSMMLLMGVSCVFSEPDDGTPNAVVVDHTSPPATNTIIEHHDTTPAPNPEVDVNVDGGSTK